MGEGSSAGSVDRDRSKQGRSRKQILRSISDGQRAAASLDRQMLRDIAEWDEREMWRDDGCANMVQWVSGRFSISHYQARLRIRSAHALDVLPRIAAALGAGELSLEKTIHLTRFAMAETEEDLLKWARRVQSSTIKKEADRREVKAIEEIRRTHRARCLRWFWTSDDTLYFEGQLPAERGLMFVETIRNLAKDIPCTSEEDEGRDDAYLYSETERRHADALYGVILNGLDQKQDGHRPEIVIYTELSDVMGDSEKGPLLHPTVVNKLMCDARLRFILTDESGNALGIGKKARNISSWIMGALRKRDRHCTFPGCRHKVFVQGHHIDRYPKGPTDLPNLVLVCDFHHDLIHKFGWEVELEGSIATWFRPSGEVFVPGPDPPVEKTA